MVGRILVRVFDWDFPGERKRENPRGGRNARCEFKRARAVRCFTGQ